MPGRGVVVDGGSLDFAGWNTADDDGTTPWGPLWVSTPVVTGTVYHAVLVFDKTSDQIEGFLNGASVGTSSGVGNLFKHSSDTGIGAINGQTLFHDGPDTSSVGYFFNGILDEVALYPTTLYPTQIANHYTLGS